MEQEPVVVPGQQWEQDTPVGGFDHDGRPPREAVSVLPVGIVTVRNVPTMEASANVYPVAALIASGGVIGQDVIRVVGAAPQRRAITIVSDVAGRLSPVAGNAQQSVGLIVPANTPIVLQCAGELWFRNTTAGVGNVSFFAEIDRG
jgi:hypothetical protein